ncbi:MAG TPA: copper amine oxidase N-terminal domain-containing protein [Candidatus Acidoferrales bacterium]|nr:copper amine oxidase N-terminal domain-containing protein [Candidatus Acidoferrales bacterium]
MAPPANFGSPPSGQIPILFNDHHVYAKPDVNKEGRVLAALVRGGTVLIPLRSMFEQMGATVSYDASSRTVDVTKAGADVKVTVGKPEVEINGESRPLDVPPIIYHGHVLVPVRVISEGMGAYVQWVPDRQIVVVRYIVPTPPPAPTPVPETPAPPPPAPPVTPAPRPTPYYEKFVAADYIGSPKVYNEFSSGQSNNNQGGFSYAIHGAAEVNVGVPLMVGADLTQWNYAHTCGLSAGGAYEANCYVTTIGQTGSTAVPAFTVSNYDFQAYVGSNLFIPHVYLDIGYMWLNNNAGYPTMSGLGSGLVKLPNLDHPFSFYGSFWYFGQVKGTTNAAFTGGYAYKFAYSILKGDIGLTYAFPSSPLFLEAGLKDEGWHNKFNAPSDATENGVYGGLGLHF